MAERRIAASVLVGQVILEEIFWDDTADEIAEISTEGIADVEALILDRIPGEIVRREDVQPDGEGIYYVEQEA